MVELAGRSSRSAMTSASSTKNSFRTILNLRRGLLIVAAAIGLTVAPAAQASTRNVEVVVTLKAPPLAQAFIKQRTLAYSSFARPHRLLASAPASKEYLS